jgi:drug/metabolite transporter (DMT)-like permease
MSASSFFKLIMLAAIWGGSFLFLRVAAPVLGPVLLIQCRVALAALFLVGLALLGRKPLDIRAHWKHFLILGLVNTAIPFVLFAWAAQVLPASLESVLNATAPIWGAILGALWTRTLPSAKTALGLVLGIAGVAILVGLDGNGLTPQVLLAAGGALLAAGCYAVAALYSKAAKSVDAFSNAHGSMWAATLCLAPVTPFFPMHALPGFWVAISVLLLGILCSGVAYVLYFGLMTEVGASQTLSVTFLIPVFGILWGNLFLHEPVTPQMIVGGLIVLVGTALITGFNPAALLRRKELPA